VREAEACNREMNRIMDKVIEDHRARRSAGAGGEEDVVLDVLLRTQTDGVPLDIGTIRAVILVRLQLSLLNNELIYMQVMGTH
jgi:hypothetical protein